MFLSRRKQKKIIGWSVFSSSSKFRFGRKTLAALESEEQIILMFRISSSLKGVRS